MLEAEGRLLDTDTRQVKQRAANATPFLQPTDKYAIGQSPLFGCRQIDDTQWFTVNRLAFYSALLVFLPWHAPLVPGQADNPAHGQH